MKKKYISANELLADSFALAEKVYLSGFQPDFIIGVWRGGAPVGIAVQEYLDYFGITSDHISIRTSSYYGINKQDKNVRVHGLQYIIDSIDMEDQLLIVDDVFESGRSIRALVDKLRSSTRRNMPKEYKIACPWYKPTKNLTDMKPDFFVHETDEWLVFPHELKDLSLDEIQENKANIAHTILPHVKKRI